MNKYFIAVMVVFATLILAGALPALMNCVSDFRTQPATDTFIVSTNLTANSTNVQLTKNLFNADTTENFSITSNITADIPVTNGYNDVNRALTIGGLSSNATRTLTVSYRKDGLTNYTGASTGIMLVPTLIVVSIIAIALTVVIFLFIH